MLGTDRKGQGSNRAARRVLIFAVAICFSGGMGWAQSDQVLPDGRGKAQFMRICSQCHGLQVATKLRNDEDGWTTIVNEMVSRGAQGTDDEFDLVIRYLTAHFGPNDAGGNAKQAGPPKVSINSAPEKDLTTFLGITAEDAQAIIHYRETAGNFKDWSDVEKVPHIDLKKLADKKDRIDFAKPPEPAKDAKE